jgi:hypothetical protein
MKPVPANNGTEPKASAIFSSSSGVIVDASLTKAFCGLQPVPNKKSEIFITEKNFILSNSNESIIPIVVRIAINELKNKTPFKIFST